MLRVCTGCLSCRRPEWLVCEAMDLLDHEPVAIEGAEDAPSAVCPEVEREHPHPFAWPGAGPNVHRDSVAQETTCCGQVRW